MRIHGDLFPLWASNYFRKPLEKEKNNLLNMSRKLPKSQILFFTSLFCHVSLIKMYGFFATTFLTSEMGKPSNTQSLCSLLWVAPRKIDARQKLSLKREGSKGLTGSPLIHQIYMTQQRHGLLHMVVDFNLSRSTTHCFA